MLTELTDLLSQWEALDSWIALTAALAAMACALPGNWLMLRKQSMMGDALSHTSLLGIVAAFLITSGMQQAGWLSAESNGHGMPLAAMFVGAVIAGVLAAVLTETVQTMGRVESSAALGVIFTTMFATGLLLLGWVKSPHIDLDCVLFGSVEQIAQPRRGETVPASVWLNGGMLVANLGLMILFFKELKISAFDAGLSTSLGIHAPTVNYLLMSLTAATLVAAFQSVGSILVIAMLIVPPATASLLTRRLGTLVTLSLVIAALSALLGHALALCLPPLVFHWLGFESVGSAGTAGMMAATAGMLFLLALVFAPTQGLLAQWKEHLKLSIGIAAEDLLGLLYRLEERPIPGRSPNVAALVSKRVGLSAGLMRLAVWRLRRRGELQLAGGALQLTDSGRTAASKLIRSHRLWEAYLAKHFELPPDHLHESAHRVEHYLDPEIRGQLSADLNEPAKDPHGRSIPDETEE